VHVVEMADHFFHGALDLLRTQVHAALATLDLDAP
jgi:alpha/beta superfamily hydrolase